MKPRRRWVTMGSCLVCLSSAPSASGMPFEDEEMAFLAALKLGRHPGTAFGGYPTNSWRRTDRELRDKVEKITEQQRRIF